MILGHEAVGEVVEVGALVRDFKCGDRVIIPAITPDWGALESQAGYSMHSGGMLAGWKFSNFKDGVFAEFFHVNEADANMAHLPADVDPVAAVMLADMVPTGFHGVELAVTDAVPTLENAALAADIAEGATEDKMKEIAQEELGLISPNQRVFSVGN